MARIPLEQWETQHAKQEIVDQFKAFIGEAKPKPQGPRKSHGAWTATLEQFKKAGLDATERMQTGNWEEAHPLTFLALFNLCHERMYGVEALEIKEATKRKTLMFSVYQVIKEQFNDDCDEYAEFVRWLFEERERKDQWIRSKGDKTCVRINAWSLTKLSLIADYKVSIKGIK